MKETQQFAVPVPYNVLPGPELRRLVVERQDLESDLDQQSWRERANREARIKEINRTLASDRHGRERIAREAQAAARRASSCACHNKQARQPEAEYLAPKPYHVRAVPAAANLAALPFADRAGLIREACQELRKAGVA